MAPGTECLPWVSVWVSVCLGVCLGCLSGCLCVWVSVLGVCLHKYEGFCLDPIHEEVYAEMQVIVKKLFLR